jgi:hypothetical protein
LEYDAINSFLKRPLADGSRYNKYFIESACKPTFLNYGDTRYTVSKMKQWAERNREQTEKLAIKEFSGMSLADTVTAIYDFLYRHIQYELDRTDQNIKSPACAWASREQGTDCKSYSVFASTILQNLGISHYFRRVRQPGINPERWTHVYVVVPKDQTTGKLNRGYHVLDATVHDNKEVAYLEKHDVYMKKVSLPHYGLQSPGLAGCSCQRKESRIAPVSPPKTHPTRVDLVRNRVLQEVGLKAPASFEEAKFQEAMVKFKLFLKDLELKGVPASVTKNATKRLQSFINSGKQPTLRDLLVPEPGLGNITAPLLTNVNQLPSSTSYFSGSRSSRSSGSGALSTISTVATAINPVVGTATGLLSSIIPKDLFDKTFGAVFANGFNFKCWGATWNPTRAEKDFTADSQVILERAKQTISTPINQLQDAINNFWVYFYGVSIKERDWIGNGAKDCTLDGLKIYVGSHDGLAIQIRNLFRNSLEAAGHKIEQTTAIKHLYPAVPSRDQRAVTWEVPQYRVILGSNQQPVANVSNGGVTRAGNVLQPTVTAPSNPVPTVQQPVNNQGNMYVDQNGQLRTTSNNINNNQNIPNNSPQQAGFSGATAIVLASIAAGTFLLSKRGNKSKSNV